MAMIECPECCTLISENADACPKCGYGLARAKKEKYKAIIGVVAFFFILIVMITVVTSIVDSIRSVSTSRTSSSSDNGFATMGECLAQQRTFQQMCAEDSWLVPDAVCNGRLKCWQQGDRYRMSLNGDEFL